MDTPSELLPDDRPPPTDHSAPPAARQGLPTASLPVPSADFAGLVLCGGQSRRMGRPKVLLPFGDETMLQRVVRLVGEVVQPVIVVAGQEQELPELAASVQIVRDRRPGRGPLEGLAAGLAALGGRAEAAFVTSCDVPLLKPALVRRLLAMLGDCDAVVPHVEGFDQPLAAVYRRSVLPHAEALLAEGRLRPMFLFDRVRTRRVPPEEFADVDPNLESLRNINTPEDYEAVARGGR